MSDRPPEAHLHLVDSFAYGWRKLNLIYEHEPRGEMPETPMPGHMIVIAQGDFRGSICVEGAWHHVDYAKGDIAILPVSELFPRTFIDREVPLIELFLDPNVLDFHRGDTRKLPQSRQRASLRPCKPNRFEMMFKPI